MEYQKDDVIKVLDYNIRCANDGENKMIVDRAPRLEALVKKYSPDVIGFQEAKRKWINEPEDRFWQDYCMRYMYRSMTSKESCPILWKRDKFKLVDEGYFWLSDSPDAISKSFGTKFHRICCWVKLKDRKTGKKFIFCNTHMAGGWPTVPSSKLILERLEANGAFTDCGAFLTGDFNIPPKHDGYNVLNDSGKLKDINDALGFNEAYTNNGYNERPDDHYYNSIKDFIFFTPDHMVPLKYEVLNESYFGGWISDHRGLYAEVALKD